MEIYSSRSLPQHWIAPDRWGDLWLFPVGSAGWERRQSYRGHVCGLRRLDAASARLVAQTTGYRP